MGNLSKRLNYLAVLDKEREELRLKSDDLDLKTDRLCVEIIRDMALDLMNTHPELNEFVMAMGTWFFVVYNKYNEENDTLTPCGEEDATFEHFVSNANGYITSYPINSDWELADVSYIIPFGKFIQKYDMSGWPMRFKRDGVVTTNW